MGVGMIRQGDVLLVPVDMLVPERAKTFTEIVLAEGEMTGHAHRVQADRVYEWEEDGQRYIQVAGKDRGALSHEDHDPVPAAVVEPNVTYKVVQQREWNLQGQWRRVLD